jgi:hypothetical protein
MAMRRNPIEILRKYSHHQNWSKATAVVGTTFLGAFAIGGLYSLT